MNAPVTRRALLGATAAVGAVGLPAVAEAAVGTALSADPNADLFRLLHRYPATLEAMREAGDRCEALWDAFVEEEPEYPTAMHRRSDDGFRIDCAVYKLRDGREVSIYEHGDVEQLRAMPQPTRLEETYTPFPGYPRDQIVHQRWVPDERRIARRAEILVAHDAWWAECQIIKDRLGIPAADDADERATLALYDLERTILATTPATFTGLAAKARWVARPGLPEHTASIWAKRITADLVALAERSGVAS